MSKSANMLRTRRKDNNVKPNRRLDRKSSRGMLFENEELRLKTININAEVERGQSDIKKLKRENDQLRREIWYLRDEYDKLDKLLREKECENSSSSSCTSESESCSSCTEELEAVETSQNIENFQKTNLKKLAQDFDHLSVVPEENSTENSEKNSGSNQPPPADGWKTPSEKDVIKADQSYPAHSTLTTAGTLPVHEKMPKHFFSPIRAAKTGEEYPNNQFLGPEAAHAGGRFEGYSPQLYNEIGFAPPPNFYPGLTLPPLGKTVTDVIVKTDNQNFNSLKSHSSFSNGGNLEELLNDIETISHDILKITNSQSQSCMTQSPNMDSSQNYSSPFASYASNFHQPPNDSPQISNGKTDGYELFNDSPSPNMIPPDRPYRSELNVVLMPSPMQLIEVEKYKEIQRSCESLNTRSLENLSSSCRSLRIVPEPSGPSLLIPPQSFYSPNSLTPNSTPIQPFVPVPPICPSPNTQPFIETSQQNVFNEQTNPFFFGSVPARPLAESPSFFAPPVNPETTHSAETNKWKTDVSKLVDVHRKDNEIYSSKANLLDGGLSSDHVSSENEENLKFKTTTGEKSSEKDKESKNNDESKSPKLGIRGKVSIHFKGKKDKSAKNDKPKLTLQDKKPSFLDLKIVSDGKQKKAAHQKTPSVESKASNAALEPKTTSSDSKASTSDNKNSKTDSKNFESSSNSISEQKLRQYDAKLPESKAPDRKNRKSSSASPERKHGHKEVKKSHKKHKKVERVKTRRSSLSADRFHRERSYSVCTDRSNILDHRMGMYSTYDDFTTSDRERTNSLSSCDTIKGRKMSNISHFHASGKIPWCGCWGNGCL